MPTATHQDAYSRYHSLSLYFFLVSFLVLFAAFMHVSSPSISTPNIIDHAVTTTTTTQPTCGFEGNNDIYGIGIRIGIYSQILAVWFANYFLLSEAHVLRDSVSIFSVALLIVTLIYSAHPADVYAIEAFVLLQILAWSCMMGVRAKSSYSKACFSRENLIRKTVCEIVNLVNVGLHVWFWWTGVGKMKETPCGTWVMMYVVKTSLYGWARKVMMAMSLFVLCCTVYWVVVEFSRPWAAWKIRVKRKEFVEAVRVWEELQGAKADEAEEKEPQDDGNGTSDDAPGPRLSQDGCSKRSGSHCSPTRSNFGLGDHVGLVRRQSEPLAQVPATSKRSSRLTTEEISFRPFTSTSPAPCPAHSITTTSRPDLTILREVYESELYIQHCIAASPYQMSTSGKPLPFSVIARSILFPKKYRTTAIGKPPPPSWLHCQIYSYFAFLTCRFPSQAFVIYSHLQQFQLLDPLNGPFQTYAAITYNPNTFPTSQDSGNSGRKTIPPWPSVSLTSTLFLISPSTPKKIWLGWYYALLDLLIYNLVILQLELTLRWNRVSGLSGLWTSVGQLIPFIIGVGGLSLVLGRWGVRAWAKMARRRGGKSGWDVDGGENEGNKEDEGEIKGAREGYERWKEVYLAQTNGQSIESSVA